MSDMPGDTTRGRYPVAVTEDARWLSYTELAAERGISRASAIRMVRRQRWRRQTGNDGEARVLVPATALPGDRPEGSDTGQTPGHALDGDTGHQGLMAGALVALEDAVSALRDQLTIANARADRLDVVIEVERGRVITVESKLAASEAALAQTIHDLDAARAAAREARERADALAKAEEARKGRGRWFRLRAAWRGE